MNTSRRTLQQIERPTSKPNNPCFSSGPCAKYKGWSLDFLKSGLFGRSHRSKAACERFEEMILLTREVLALPDEYRVAMISGSDTGAMEMAMWNLLGSRGVDVLSHDRFSRIWLSDILYSLKIKDVRSLDVPYGELPDVTKVDFSRDVVFAWSGTPAGVAYPNAHWIPDYTKREGGGLVLCDFVAAIGAVDVPWDKLDVASFSWQKIFGGEAAHGMVVLSPRAYERLETYTPNWPIPKIFRLKDNGTIFQGAFSGYPINTVSLMCVEDYLTSLRWAKSIGGTAGMQRRTLENFQYLQNWIDERPHRYSFLAKKVENRSVTTSVITLSDSSLSQKKNLPYEIAALLEKEMIAYDIKGHADAPPSLRVWTGPTVETDDIKILLEWIDWAYETLRG